MSSRFTPRAPGDPAFWVPGPLRLRVVSPVPVDSPPWCSAAPWGQTVYRAGYQIATDRDWDFDPGGIHIPTGVGSTYSTMMPLSGDPAHADVWVAPGVLPGS